MKNSNMASDIAYLSRFSGSSSAVRVMNLRKMPMYAGLEKMSSIDTLATFWPATSCLSLDIRSVSERRRRAW